jgi:hypothetical protein
MKRSEMVDQLADFLANHYDAEWRNRKDHVLGLLYFLENRGMNPPYELKDKLQEDCTYCYRYDCGWEKEDETT